MSKLTDKRQIRNFTFLFTVVYMVSYITYGIALISHKFGWTLTLEIWFSIALAGTAICLACAKPWDKSHK